MPDETLDNQWLYVSQIANDTQEFVNRMKQKFMMTQQTMVQESAEDASAQLFCVATLSAMCYVRKGWEVQFFAKERGLKFS